MTQRQPTIYIYKNISDQQLMLAGVGLVDPGDTVEVTFLIENPNFEVVEQSKKAKQETEYMENCFFATKVAFVNEFREIVERFEGNWQAVRQGWLLDPRVSPDHSDSFASARGFGGKCLPKDLS